MHIVGIDGMPRRNYTYPAGLGWGPENLAETIGSYITTAGIVLLLANLVVSYFRGLPAGPDPWHGATLEWTIPSPPPEYNFAVIPKVSSAYANWDYADREEDRRKLAEGIMVLEQGHEQPVSSPVDGWWAEIVEMPHDSPWPIALALAMSLVFVLLLLHQWLGAGFALSAIALALMGWHGEEPQESEA
jgi:cytochrome c oxidase subunit 1/cytochrome c oxidase subunit I+III